MWNQSHERAGRTFRVIHCTTPISWTRGAHRPESAQLVGMEPISEEVQPAPSLLPTRGPSCFLSLRVLGWDLKVLSGQGCFLETCFSKEWRRPLGTRDSGRTREGSAGTTAALTQWPGDSPVSCDVTGEEPAVSREMKSATWSSVTLLQLEMKSLQASVLLWKMGVLYVLLRFIERVKKHPHLECAAKCLVHNRHPATAGLSSLHPPFPPWTSFPNGERENLQ